MDIPFSNPSMANLGQILGNLAEPLALTGCLVTARYLDFLAAGGLAGYLAGKLARGSAGGKSVLTLLPACSAHFTRLPGPFCSPAHPVLPAGPTHFPRLPGSWLVPGAGRWGGAIWQSGAPLQPILELRGRSVGHDRRRQMTTGSQSLSN